MVGVTMEFREGMELYASNLDQQKMMRGGPFRSIPTLL